MKNIWAKAILWVLFTEVVCCIFAVIVTIILSSTIPPFTTTIPVFSTLPLLLKVFCCYIVWNILVMINERKYFERELKMLKIWRS